MTVPQIKNLADLVVNPKAIAALYGLCILLFALIYHSLPTGFYAPYARLESYGTQDVADVVQIYGKAVRRRANNLSQENGATDSEWRSLDVRGINISSYTGVDASEALHLDFAVWTKKDDGLHQIIFGAIARRQGHLTLTSSKRSAEQELLEIEPDNVIHEPISEEAQRIFKLMFHRDGFEGLGLLEVNEEEHDKIDAFFAGVAGDATNISGSWLRMLYLSAIVITTIGFGDIVPITGMARLAVSLEGVAGITIMGLFVNAVAVRAARNEVQRNKEN